MKKRYIDAKQLLVASFALAARIHDSGFRPTFIVGIWRGGAPVAIAAHEYLRYKGIHADHIAIRAQSYTDIGKPSAVAQIHGLRYLAERLRADDKLLLVDDIFDTGKSIQAALDAIAGQTAPHTPQTIKTACPWFNPRNNQTDLKPDYHLYETDAWLVFPHELQGLTEEEIRQHKPELAQALNIARDT